MPEDTTSTPPAAIPAPTEQNPTKQDASHIMQACNNHYALLCSRQLGNGFPQVYGKSRRCCSDGLRQMRHSKWNWPGEQMYAQVPCCHLPAQVGNGSAPEGFDQAQDTCWKGLHKRNNAHITTFSSPDKAAMPRTVVTLLISLSILLALYLEAVGQANVVVNQQSSARQAGEMPALPAGNREPGP